MNTKNCIYKKLLNGLMKCRNCSDNNLVFCVMRFDNQESLDKAENIISENITQIKQFFYNLSIPKALGLINLEKD